MESKIPELILQAIQKGVDITLSMRSEGTIVYNLNTETKSHIHAVVQDDSLLLALRYNEQMVVSTWDELLDAVEHAKHGRDYINYTWDKILLNRKQEEV